MIFFRSRIARVSLAGLFAMVTVGMWLTAAEPTPGELRAASKKKMDEGNFKDAYEGYRKITLDPKADAKTVGDDLKLAINCLQRLNRSDEIDAYRDEVINVHQKNWRLLQSAAISFVEGEPYGFLVAGKFYRGNKRGGGQWVQSTDRDRVRALQLMQQALPLVKEEADKAAAGRFYLNFAHHVLHHRGYADAWRLQVLTDLATLPYYEQGGYGWGRWGRGGGNQNGAPVDPDGNPVYHKVSESWETAKTDGERWRWLLSTAARTEPSLLNESRVTFANFLREQFDVQTMAHYSWFLGQQMEEEDKDESGPYAVHTLKESETIARLATGAKRFTLPEEFQFIRIYREVAAAGKSTQGEQAQAMLAQIFEDRRQYPTAATEWKTLIDQYGAGPNNWRTQRLQQIVGSWGRFEMISMQSAGKEAVVDFRYRNGKKVTFEAHEIHVEKLLTDVKAYLKSSPAQLNWQQLNIQNLGYRLVEQNQKQYLGERSAQFDLELSPRPKHFDSLVTVKTPLKKAGAYLLTAKMDNGNVSRVIVWLADTVLAQKQLDGQAWYFVADAVTGQPVPKANVEFFGYRQEQVKPGVNQYKVSTANFAENSDANGQAFPDPKLLAREYQWMIIARGEGGRLAHLGFNSVWYGPRYNYVYDQNKVFVVTDRPVYRPNQPMKFKFWIRNARYDKDTDAKFANDNFTVRLTNPRGETVWDKPFTTDEYGGFDGEWEIPSGAPLGQYNLQVINRNDVGGGGQFRVEEYKKPEFEVTVDAPTEPVMLGEKITATVNAKYYFGTPVVNAKVHYKVTRVPHSSQWFPVGKWDWFYQPGYWWFAPESNWYPGFGEWGCRRPIPPWWGQPHVPPEVVSDNTVDVGPDGTVKIEIDTAIAKAVHSDQDHKYEVTAEVTDESRRTIVGSGNVLVARKPFKVFSWLDHGHYRVGDTIGSHFKAQTLDQKPVEGTGKLRLLEVTYDEDSKPVEKEVQSWELATNAQGEASQQIKASKAGQYRLSYTVTDKAGHTIEGGYLFTIIGEGSDSSKFRFNSLELILEKREYKPGDKVKLMINTDREKSTVLLFLRSENSVYQKPVFLKLDGKSMVYEFTVETRDMPNMYVEAITIADAKLHTEVREVVVPPEQRVANVEVVASAAEYKPGQDAKISLKLTDADGKPFVGSTVLSIYDKSVEYISGGSNVPEIKAFFWKFRRNHHPQTQSSLSVYFNNLLKSGETGMSNLGAFGQLVWAHETVEKGQARRSGGSDKQAAKNMLVEEQAAGGYALAAAAPMENRALRKANANGAEMDRATDALAKRDGKDGGDFGGAGGENFVEPTVRKNFADTALWVGKLVTDAKGLAEVSLKMPENLTGWKIRAWTLGKGVRVGQGEATVVTAKQLLVRLQAPRFFTETDEVVLSANVHNYLAAAKKVKVSLELEGETLGLMKADTQTQTIEIDAKGEKRIDWRVKAVKEGMAVVRMKALSDEESDAMEMKFPVYVHGMLKTESYAGFVRRTENSGLVTVNVPEQRRINQSKLEVRFSPTLAGAMVDALPYLVSYPHETTDTTLNRFLPTVITQNILKRMEIDLKEVQKKRTNLNAQEIGDDVERAKQWKRYEHNPVFDIEEVDRMTKTGVKALTEMQLSDGGWGWFSGYGERSDAHTTALVLHGLQIAQENGVAIVPDVFQRGVAWLKAYQDRQIDLLINGDRKKALPKDEGIQKLPSKSHADNLDALVYMVLVDDKKVDDRMHAYLYRDRVELAVYAKALFGLALHKQNDKEKLAMVMQNIDQFLVQDDENQTAYLKLPENNWWWHWYGSDVEANSFYLKLLAKTEPQSEKAARMAKYLLNNRKHATYWNSTRDTAFAIEAMAEFLVASGEEKPNLTVEVYFDGKKQKEVKIDSKNLFTFDNRFELVGDAIETGEHKVELRKQGAGPLYFNAYMTNFTLEEFITNAGLEIKVQRKYYKLNRKDKEIQVAGQRGQAVGQRIEKYEREEIKNLGELKSGDLLEIEMEIDSKNDYEYLVFEDLKAAGCEPTEVRSGYNGNSMGAYVEFRDERVNFFVRYLARGKHSVSYRLRAETPGKFSALPAKGFAMYAPELRGNSDEIKISIVD